MHLFFSTKTHRRCVEPVVSFSSRDDIREPEDAAVVVEIGHSELIQTHLRADAIEQLADPRRSQQTREEDIA